VLQIYLQRFTVFRLLTEIENICLEKICTIFKNIRVNLSHLPVPKFNEKPITRSRRISTIVLKYRHANCTDLIGANCTKKANNLITDTVKLQQIEYRKSVYNPCMIIKLNSQIHTRSQWSFILYFFRDFFQILYFKIFIIMTAIYRTTSIPLNFV